MTPYAIRFTKEAAKDVEKLSPRLKRLLQNPCGRRGRRPSHSESRRFLANREGPRPRGLVPGEVLQEPLKEKLKVILLQQVAPNPRCGKRLVGDLAEFLSLRLSYKDRVVYSVDDDTRTVFIHQC